MLRTPHHRIRLADRKEISQIEDNMQSQFPKVQLMENASQKAGRFIEKNVMPYLPIDSILILVGPGNNGKDGICVARYLAKKGYSHIQICLFNESQEDFLKQQLHKIPAYQVETFTFKDTSDIRKRFQNTSLIVDGLFGIGLHHEVTNEYAKAIHLVNQSLLPVLSLDVPSGLNCNTGRVMGVCIEAQWTVTFGLSKPGFYIWDGPRTVGELHCLDIGFAEKIVETTPPTLCLFDHVSALKFLPQRQDVSNKSQNGRTCVIAGKKGMWGAGILASSGAFRAGSGYVTLASREDPAVAASQRPDILTCQFTSVSEVLSPQSAVAIGPGLGVGQHTIDIIQELLSLDMQNVVLDADALTSLSQMPEQKLHKTWLLTPHSGEMAKLLHCTAEQVDKDRVQAVKDCSVRYGCHVLLKGYKTLLGYCDDKETQVEVINSGNASLATAGTGDVLCGMIAGFVAQGLNIRDSGALGGFFAWHNSRSLG